MMSRSTDEFDDLIREVLDDSDGEVFDELQARSTAELLTETFRGRHRWLAIGAVVVNLVLFGAAVLSGIRFVGADDLRSMALWGVAMMLCFATVTTIKIWYWLEMNRLAITREVKRVELRLVQMAKRLSDEAGK
jgi:hypothetical protein